MTALLQLLTAVVGSDTAPDSFNFTDQTGVSVSTLTTSNTITPTGYNSLTSWTCTGGTASISGGAYTSSGVIAPGQTVTLRLTSSSSNSTLASATFTAGGISDVWNVTTAASPAGQQVFTANGSFVVPANVTRISTVGIGAGGTGLSSKGGSLSYVNTITVTPGETLTVVVGTSAGADTSLARSGTTLLRAKGGGSGSANVGTAFEGGATGTGSGGGGTTGGAGGGGAGGYSANGGNGGNGGNPSSTGNTGDSGSGGSGGGGGGGGGDSGGSLGRAGGGGGGTGLLGTGSNGTGGSGGNAGNAGSPGTGGSSGSSGFNESGGLYGGAAASYGGTAANGGLRIMWPGDLRLYPSTRTANE